MTQKLDFVNQEIVSLLFRRVPSFPPEGLIANLEQAFSSSKGCGCLIHGQEYTFKSEVARFLFQWAREYLIAEACWFIDIFQEKIETPQQLYARIDEARDKNELRMLIIDHIDMLRFSKTPFGASESESTDTRRLQSLIVKDGLVIIAIAGQSGMEIDPGNTNDGIRQFIHFQLTADGWVSPDEGPRLLDAFLLNYSDRDRVCQFAESYSYHWKALHLLALGDEPEANKVLNNGIVSLVDRLELADNQLVLSEQNLDYLRRRGIWKSSDAPPWALLKLFEKELLRRAETSSVFDDDFPLPAEHCDVDRIEWLHDYDSFRKLDQQDGLRYLRRLQDHVKHHMDTCDQCKNVLNSREVKPLVDDLLRASWSTESVPRLEFVTWSIKCWIRGLRGLHDDRVPVPFFKNVVEQHTGNDLHPAPAALKCVPESDKFFYHEVIAPIYGVVRAVRRLRDGKHEKAFENQRLNIRMLDHDDYLKRRFAVELLDGPLVPLKGGSGTTIRSLEALCAWVAQDDSRFFCLSQEYKDGKRTIRLEFKTISSRLELSD